MNKNIPSRREFIKNLSLWAGTSAVISSLPWIKMLHAQESGSSSNAENINIGIIGPGSRGILHMHHLNKIPNVTISAVCDIYEPNLQEGLALTNGKAKTYKDYRKLLEHKDLDAVIIATPLFEHARMTIDALQAGKQVFCEKAMAMTIDDCYNMYKTKLETGNMLVIGHQRMFDPKYLQAYELVKSGRIGDITQIRGYWHRNNNWRRPVPKPHLEEHFNWRLYRDYSCGLMTELGSHHFQIANWFLGQRPEYVMGSGSVNYWRDGREVNDNVQVIFKYPNNTHMVWDSVTSNKFYGMQVQIMGPEGTIESETGKIYSENPPPASGILQLINNIENQIFDAVPIGGASWVPETANKNEGKYILEKNLKTDGTDLMLEAFVNAVRNGHDFPEVTRQGLLASVATLMGYNAILNQEIVHWPEKIIV
jgi:predicted dehydrogenase